MYFIHFKTDYAINFDSKTDECIKFKTTYILKPLCFKKTKGYNPVTFFFTKSYLQLKSYVDFT